VANKLFPKTSGSHSFVADDDVIEVPDYGGGCRPDADAGRCVKRQQPQERGKTLKYKYAPLPPRPFLTRANGWMDPFPDANC
jgi:hypothetical protein